MILLWVYCVSPTHLLEEPEELEVPTFKEEFGGLTVTIKREISTEIQREGRVDDKTGRIVKNDISKREKGCHNVVSGVGSLSQYQLTE